MKETCVRIYNKCSLPSHLYCLLATHAFPRSCWIIARVCFVPGFVLRALPFTPFVLLLGYQAYLVGDPVQLPATVISNRARDHGYDCSLFKRLQVGGASVFDPSVP
jgi:hypothetical protein